MNVVRAIALSLAILASSACSSAPPANGQPPDAGPGGDDAGGDDAAVGSPSVAFVVSGQAVAPGAHVLYGERAAILVTGMAPGETVVVTTTEKQISTPFTSTATFAADGAGTVDTSVLAPVHAGYSGVDVDGPIWSAAASKNALAVPTNALGVQVAGTDGSVLGGATLARDFVSPATKGISVTDDGLVGEFYAPQDGKRHAAIIAFGGSEGGLSAGETFAAYWAARGYAVLGLAYFGAAGLPLYLERIPLEYFAKAMTWLDGRPEADATRLAVMGGSRGGELALLLGATYPRIKAVVAYVPSGVLWGGYDGTKEVASWTLAGQDLPYVPFDFSASTTSKDSDGTTLLSEAPAFLQSLKEVSRAVTNSATTRVEKTQGPVLMLAGQDDQLWASCALSQFAMSRLTVSGHAARYHDALVCYPSTGHNISFPGLSTMGVYRTPDPYGNDDLLLGGTPAGIAHASRDSDDRIAALLHDALQ